MAGHASPLPVADRDIVVFEQEDDDVAVSSRLKNNGRSIYCSEAPSLSLVATAIDAQGNVATKYVAAAIQSDTADKANKNRPPNRGIKKCQEHYWPAFGSANMVR